MPLTAEEIRFRLDAYLATPGLSLAEKEAGLEYLEAHPEVAAAVGHGIEPEEVLRQAEVVLRLHAETRLLVATMPAGMTRFRAASEVLARIVRVLIGSET